MRLPWQRKREITDQDIIDLFQAQNLLNAAQIQINASLAARVEALESMIFNEGIFKHVDQRTRH